MTIVFVDFDPRANRDAADEEIRDLAFQQDIDPIRDDLPALIANPGRWALLHHGGLRPPLTPWGALRRWLLGPDVRSSDRRDPVIVDKWAACIELGLEVHTEPAVFREMTDLYARCPEGTTMHSMYDHWSRLDRTGG